MLSNIHSSFKDLIESTEWLDDSTRMAALNKLSFISGIISFVEWMADPQEINNSYKTVRFFRYY